MRFRRKALPAGPRMEFIDLIERGRSPAPSPCPHPLPPHAPLFAGEGHEVRGTGSTPLALGLCSVLITLPAFGIGSGIRRGRRRGGGPSGFAGPGHGAGWRDGGGDAEDPPTPVCNLVPSPALG